MKGQWHLDNIQRNNNNPPIASFYRLKIAFSHPVIFTTVQWPEQVACGPVINMESGDSGRRRLSREQHKREDALGSAFPLFSPFLNDDFKPAPRLVEGRVLMWKDECGPRAPCPRRSEQVSSGLCCPFSLSVFIPFHSLWKPHLRWEFLLVGPVHRQTEWQLRE